MEEIINTTLSNIVNSGQRAIISGPFGSNISKKYFVSKGIPVIRGNNLNISSGTFNDSGYVYVTDKKATDLNCYAHKGDLIFTAAGTLGQVGVIPSDARYNEYVISNKQIRVTIDTNKVDTLYAYYWFSSPWIKKYLVRNNKGSTVPLLTLSEIKLIPIKYPSSLSVQRKIVRLLQNIDSKIANNDAISKELESMAKTIYNYWFLQFEFPDKDGKPYKSNGGKMVWNDQLKQEIPEGWEVSTVKRVLGDYPKTKTIESKEYHLGTIYPIVDQSKDSYICGYTDNKEKILDLPDVIVFGDHSNKSKYVNFPFARGADGTQILNSNNPKLPNYILYQQIISLPEIEKGYSRHFKFLKAQNIIIPTLNTAKKYMSIVGNMLVQQRQIIKENQQLKSLRDFLLPMLMNGQVTIKD